MDQIATATIDGPDTTGTATLFETEMNYVIQLHDMDIHAGAPDVYAALTANPTGELDDSIEDLAMLGYHNTNFEIAFPKSIDPHKTPIVLIYCKLVAVHFGHGPLEFGTSS